jgi:hypothetical protein
VPQLLGLFSERSRQMRMPVAKRVHGDA